MNPNLKEIKETPINWNLKAREIVLQ